MKKLLLALLLSASCYGTIYRFEKIDAWVKEGVDPFDEMIISWNAKRPCQGSTRIYIRVKTEGWSSWLLYAEWGQSGQTSYQHKEGLITVFQDTIRVEGIKASAFEIKMEGADLDMRSLYVYTNSDENVVTREILPEKSFSLPLKGLSQIALGQPLDKRGCSPTSSAAVLAYLLQKPIDVENFANAVWDRGFDIYGHWVFNVAEAANLLDAPYECYISRLSGFNEIYSHLEKGFPVVVSVRGPLPGSAAPYASGHLLVVSGYDALNDRVLCMDPAFPTHAETLVSYDREHFVQAWQRRGRIAYIFSIFD